MWLLLNSPIGFSLLEPPTDTTSVPGNGFLRATHNKKNTPPSTPTTNSTTNTDTDNKDTDHELPTHDLRVIRFAAIVSGSLFILFCFGVCLIGRAEHLRRIREHHNNTTAATVHHDTNESTPLVRGRR